MNSRRKGKVGEREFAALLRENGFDARRGQQFSGSPESPDVVSEALSWLHVEVKRVQNLNLTDACVQAEGDCGGNKSMRIKTNGGNFQPCPEYTGSAVCVDVTPLKTVQTQYGPKEKFRFVFEIGETKEDGTPWCVWSAPFTPSYHENSALRPFLRKWMGRELTAEETKTFDTEEMLGRPAHVTVVHEHSNGEVYANIALIQPDKAAAPLKPSGKFVRMKDRQAAPAGQSGYRRAEQAAEAGGDLGATKIHVGKCKGLEVRDLSPEQVGALVERWLPTAKANAKPTADDKRLIAALEAWQAAQAVTAAKADDEVPF